MANLCVRYCGNKIFLKFKCSHFQIYSKWNLVWAYNTSPIPQTHTLYSGRATCAVCRRRRRWRWRPYHAWTCRYRRSSQRWPSVIVIFPGCVRSPSGSRPPCCIPPTADDTIGLISRRRWRRRWRVTATTWRKGPEGGTQACCPWGQTGHGVAVGPCAYPTLGRSTASTRLHTATARTVWHAALTCNTHNMPIRWQHKHVIQTSSCVTLWTVIFDYTLQKLQEQFSMQKSY